MKYNSWLNTKFVINYTENLKLKTYFSKLNNFWFKLFLLDLPPINNSTTVSCFITRIENFELESLKVRNTLTICVLCVVYIFKTLGKNVWSFILCFKRFIYWVFFIQEFVIHYFYRNQSTTYYTIHNITLIFQGFKTRYSFSQRLFELYAIFDLKYTYNGLK